MPKTASQRGHSKQRGRNHCYIAHRIPSLSSHCGLQVFYECELRGTDSTTATSFSSPGGPERSRLACSTAGGGMTASLCIPLGPFGQGTAGRLPDLVSLLLLHSNTWEDPGMGRVPRRCHGWGVGSIKSNVLAQKWATLRHLWESRRDPMNLLFPRRVMSTFSPGTALSASTVT